MKIFRQILLHIAYLLLLYTISCQTTEDKKKKWTPPESKPWKEVRVRLDSLTKGQIQIATQSGYFEKEGKREEFVNRVSMESLFLMEEQRVKIVPNSGRFLYKNREYRGNIELYKKFKTIHVINLVTLEDYLKSVVPSEMPASWHLEALKAQAVAARTYALHNILYPKFEDYHLEADVMSQMYTGTLREHPNSTKAVEETRGMIMVYEDQLVQAFYHSNSGGITEVPEMVWGLKLDYMKSVPSLYCIKVDNLDWEYHISPSFLVTKFGLNIGKIEDLEIKERSPSGRVKTLLVKGNQGEAEILGKDFRMSVGGVKVKSLLFDITKTPTDYILKGKGFGHGVGMSQWGSFNMAKDDKNFETILKFYYTGVELDKLPE